MTHRRELEILSTQSRNVHALSQLARVRAEAKEENEKKINNDELKIHNFQFFSPFES